MCGPLEEKTKDYLALQEVHGIISYLNPIKDQLNKQDANRFKKICKLYSRLYDKYMQTDFYYMEGEVPIWKECIIYIKIGNLLTERYGQFVSIV